MAMHIFSAGNCPICKRGTWNDEIRWSIKQNGYICKDCKKKEDAE